MAADDEADRSPRPLDDTRRAYFAGRTDEELLAVLQRDGYEFAAAFQAAQEEARRRNLTVPEAREAPEPVEDPREKEKRRHRKRLWTLLGILPALYAAAIYLLAAENYRFAGLGAIVLVMYQGLTILVGLVLLCFRRTRLLGGGLLLAVLLSMPACVLGVDHADIHHRIPGG